MTSLNHANHIVGLRALAILPVIAFHTNPNLFSNGYLGVDIFFVISGYLITGSLIDNYKKINFKNIKNFYIKRARRTLPALIFVVLITLPLFLYILRPTDLIDYGQSLVATPLFLTNFLFGTENTYWGTLSELKPLLHIWSLSIEWQFYLIFPFIFLFQSKKKIIFIVFLSSLLISVLINFNDFHLDLFGHIFRLDHFFISINRIWEFLAGTLLFLYGKNFPKISYSNAFSLLGIIILVFSFIFFDKNLKHPGAITLLPILGTILVIKFSEKNTTVNYILNNSFLIHIGTISYSLYLWHQPLLAYFKNILNNNISYKYQFLAILISYLLSVVSFKFIEKTFYKKSFLKDQFFLIFVFLGMILIILSGSFIINKKGNLDNNISIKLTNINNKFPNILNVQNRTIQKESYKNKLPSIKNFIDDDRYKISVSGDSYAIDLHWMLTQNKLLNKNFQFLLNYSDDADAIILSKQFDENETNFNYFFNLKKSLDEKNQKLILMGRPNEFHVGNLDPLTLFLTNNTKNIKLYEQKKYEIIDRYFYTILRDNNFRINNKIKLIANKLDIIYLERIDYACDKKKLSCKSTDLDGNPIYSDLGHLTVKGSIILNKLMNKKNWFNPINELAETK